MSDPIISEVLELNKQLLESIAKGDWHAYQELCDPTLTAFEPEARGHMIKGGGAALTREKIVADISDRFVCIADESKLVTTLGRFALPLVELAPDRGIAVRAQFFVVGGEEDRMPRRRSTEYLAVLHREGLRRPVRAA